MLIMKPGSSGSFLPMAWVMTWSRLRVMAIWYETVAIGVTGKHVVEKIQREVPEFKNLGISFNFGHLSHSEEWTDGLFTLTKGIPLRSGMLIQCDIRKRVQL